MPASVMRTAIALLLAMGCDSNPFDATQQPVVAVTQGAVAGDVTISWQPSGAQLVRVYRGATAGDGYTESLMWSIAATTQNSLVSPVRYGVAASGGTTDLPPKPLAPGAVYTVQVARADPKGSGDGFTNTSNRYVSTATFTISIAQASR